MKAAGEGCEVFGFGSGVFAAVEGADGVDFANCFALGIVA